MQNWFTSTELVITPLVGLMSSRLQSRHIGVVEITASIFKLGKAPTDISHLSAVGSTSEGCNYSIVSCGYQLTPQTSAHFWTSMWGYETGGRRFVDHPPKHRTTLLMTKLNRFWNTKRLYLCLAYVWCPQGIPVPSLPAVSPTGRSLAATLHPDVPHLRTGGFSLRGDQDSQSTGTWLITAGQQGVVLLRSPELQKPEPGRAWTQYTVLVEYTVDVYSRLVQKFWCLPSHFSFPWIVHLNLHINYFSLL